MTKHYLQDEWRDWPLLERKDESGAGDGGEPDPVKAIEELSTALTGKMDTFSAELKKVNDKVDAEIAKRNRPGTESKSGDEAGELERKAFTLFLRKGREALSPDETKSLRVSDDTAGGYLSPPQLLAELDRNLVLFSPIRAAARIANTTAGSVLLPARTGTLTAYWVSEGESRTESQPTYGQREYPIFEAAVYSDVSNRLLEDAAFNIEAELAFDFGEEFGRLEGNAFVKGSGVKQPLGLINTSGISTVKTGDANGFKATANAPFDCIMDLYHALPGAYAANAVWGMNRTTMGTVRKIKDSQNRYLWADPVAQGQPATILGRPVVEMPDLDDVSANKLPIVFGDFRHFRIYDRVALSVLRDPYSRATNGETRFHARRRVGGGVSRTEAFRFLKVEA